jgi:hypothetical protein
VSCLCVARAHVLEERTGRDGFICVWCGCHGSKADSTKCETREMRNNNTTTCIPDYHDVQ